MRSTWSSPETATPPDAAPICATAAPALKAVQTSREPATKANTTRAPRCALRPLCIAAKRSITGAADAVIIPTIITAHIANVKKMSAALNGMSIVMPMSAIIVSCFIAADI